MVSSENYLNPSQTRFTRTATAAFIETQAEALSPDSTDLSKTRKRVQKKVRQAIKELGGTMPENLPKHGKTIKQFEREKKRIEGKKE
ncbi:MAG: hypothetical protein HZC13_00210 [Nitrospirae bacterium]|nr:hypothetical protein [Nitrospirota bacterium]